MSLVLKIAIAMFAVLPVEHYGISKEPRMTDSKNVIKTWVDADERFCNTLADFRTWLREERARSPERAAAYEAATAHIRQHGISKEHAEHLRLARVILRLEK